MRSFIWRNGLYVTDRLVTAIPCQDLFVRTLSFPFKDSAKLAQVVPFEVENLVPMPLEDLAVGSLILPPEQPIEGSVRESKGSDVLVTAAPRDKVAEHLRFLAQADVEPSAINVDAMALFSVTQYLQEEGATVPPDLAIIDVGASKTTLCLVQGGRPVVLRTILWGGNHLTHALAVRHACGFADAERHKRTVAVDQVHGLLEPIHARTSNHAAGLSRKRAWAFDPLLGLRRWVETAGNRELPVSTIGTLPGGTTPGIRTRCPTSILHRVWFSDSSPRSSGHAGDLNRPRSGLPLT
ncbi:MAG: pilus assembly protein PilM [Nitrospira sp.]|nr:pilus assembly protein PilM [Nitrospira sp.]